MIKGLLGRFKHREKSSLAIDIGAASIKVVALSSIHQKPTVDYFSQQALPAGAVIHQKINHPEKIAHCLQPLVANISSKNRQVLVALTEDKITSRKLSLDKGSSESDIEAVIELEFEQLFSCPRDTMQFDYYQQEQSLASGDTFYGQCDIEIIACPVTTIKQIINILRTVDLEVDIIDVDSFSTIRLFQYVRRNQQTKRRRQALIDFGSNSSRLMMFFDGALIGKREIQIGGRYLIDGLCQKHHVSYQKALDILINMDELTEDIKPIVESFAENFSQELMVLIEYFCSSADLSQLDEVVLAGGCACISKVREDIEHYLQTPVVVLDPWHDIDVNDCADRQQLKVMTPMMVTATGLALRGLQNS